VKTTAAVVLSTLMAAGAGALVLPATAGAGGFGPMNMMNPGRWFGGRDRYDDDYYGRGGHPPPPPPAYSAPPPRYGAPAYAPTPAAPATAASTAYEAASKERIKRLETRILELEARREQSVSPPYTGGYRPNSTERYNPGDSYSQPSYGAYSPPPQTGMGGTSGAYQPSNRESVTQAVPGSPYDSRAPVFRPTN
jgi:hypothetical protein